MAEGPEVGTAYVSILPSAAGFGAKLQTLVAGEATTAGQKAGQALGTGITGQAAGIAKGVAGVFAAVGAARFLKGSIAEAEDAARVGRLTEAVIRSTGGAAGVSADQVEKLAGSLSKVAGVDDEVIQSAENVLLTFTKVSGQVFPQATKAALDMSAALGGDLQGSIIQLGKALQDPTQGLLALRRSGVSFTEAQQDQIKALQQTGDLLGAQKIILEEVNREFGGAAAAGATATAKLGVAVGNLKESLGTALLPAVNVTAGALEGLLGGFNDLPGPAQTAAGILVLAAGGFTAASLAAGLLIPKIRAAKTELLELGVAGRVAGTGIAVAGRALAVGGILLGLHEIGIQINRLLIGTTSIPKLGEALKAFTAGAGADGELLRRFGGDIDDIAGSLTGLEFRTKGGNPVSRFFSDQARALGQHSEEFARSKERVEALDDALAGMVQSGGGAAAQAFVDQLTASLRAQGADVDGIVGQLDDYRVAVTNAGHATGAAAGEIDEASLTAEETKRRWDELRGSLEDLVASDWSKQLASNLTSALDPMTRFVVGSGENIDDLKGQVASAKTELDSATAALAAFEGTGTAAEIARIRGQAGDIDAARAKVADATTRFRDAGAELAAAQKSPLATITDNLKTNLATITAWLANLGKVQDRLGGTAGEELAKHLGSLGPQAADAIAEAARLKPADLAKLEGLFDQADTAISDAASGAFELRADQAGKPGETLAEIIAARYEATLTPKFTEATLAALRAATDSLLGPGSPGGSPLLPSVSPGIPGVTPAAGGLPAPLGFGTAGPSQITIPFQVTTNADPRQVAAEVGDHLAWRLAGPARAAL